MSSDPVEWLRKQIEARRALALSAMELESGAERTEPDSCPQDTIARCEAELAILDRYELAVAEDRAQRSAYRAWATGDRLPPRPVAHGAPAKMIPGLAAAVEILASAYRHRPGYNEHWGEAGSE